MKPKNSLSPSNCLNTAYATRGHVKKNFNLYANHLREVLSSTDSRSNTD